jgi:hypothetical protein
MIGSVYVGRSFATLTGTNTQALGLDINKVRLAELHLCHHSGIKDVYKEMAYATFTSFSIATA